LASKKSGKGAETMRRKKKSDKKELTKGGEDLG